MNIDQMVMQGLANGARKQQQGAAPIVFSGEQMVMFVAACQTQETPEGAVQRAIAIVAESIVKFGQNALQEAVDVRRAAARIKESA